MGILTHPSYSLQTLKQNKNDEGNSSCSIVSLCVAQKPGPYKEVPKPYSYQYGVADDYSKANFQHTEAQDGNGNVSGQYVIALPDGRIQTTKYTADHVNGYIAEVSYQGTPVYPKETKPYSAN